MKKLLLILFCFAGIAAAQSVIYGEYYYDTDPGFGSGIPISVSAGTAMTIEFAANIAQVTDGIHLIYTRFLDANGHWSLPASRVFLKTIISQQQPAAKLLRGEYYFNTDPGNGYGTPITIANDSVVVVELSASISSLPEGIHLFYTRFLDVNGKWSLPASRVFLKAPNGQLQPLPELVSGEYFFDTDPGYGKGLPIQITSGTSINMELTAALAQLSIGSHTFHVRFMDANKKWSLPVQSAFQRDTTSGLQITGLQPMAYELCQNFPNPFNPSTTIAYAVPERSQVKITVYAENGEYITTLVNEEKGAGFYSCTWNAGSYASGMYIYKLQTEKFQSVKKLLLVK